jgi:hypothetical protein
VPEKIKSRKRINFRAIWTAFTGRAARARVWHLFVRIYALFLVGLVLYAGYLAVHYLVLTVFFPPQVPAKILDWPGRLDVAALRSTENPGVEIPAPRAPVSHYHSVDRWFQVDSQNGCVVDGCHEALPHDRRAKVPAFANFHTTFLTCEMCHAASARRPVAAHWVNIDTGKPAEIPTILRLMAYLELNEQVIQAQPADAQQDIIPLLSKTVATLGGDGELDNLLAQMQSAQPGSPVWKQAVAELTAELPQHARGEYGAKLAHASDDRAAMLDSFTEQSANYEMSSKNPDQLKSLHSPLASAPATCLACHDDQPGMLDFAAVGYSPKRTKSLGSLAVARLMQHIREGQSFYLPNLQEGVP